MFGSSTDPGIKLSVEEDPEPIAAKGKSFQRVNTPIPHGSISVDNKNSKLSNNGSRNPGAKAVATVRKSLNQHLRGNGGDGQGQS